LVRLQRIFPSAALTHTSVVGWAQTKSFPPTRMGEELLPAGRAAFQTTLRFGDHAVGGSAAG